MRFAADHVSLADRPDTNYKFYLVVFAGGRQDDRRPDQALLRSVGAVERRYLAGLRAATVWMRPAQAALLAESPAVVRIDLSVPGTGDVPLGETVGWTYTRHGFDVTYAASYRGLGARVAVIGDGVECALPEIPCGVGVAMTPTGNPNIDHGSGHETAVAAIIAGAVGNNTGIRGGAPYASIHSVWATVGPGDIPCPNSTEAFDLAADPNGPIQAHVVNYSYGSYEPCQARDNVIMAHFQVLFVAPTGNNTGPVRMPASHPYTIAVAGTTAGDTRVYDSNFGPEVTISAGGENVKSVTPTGNVATFQGTSFAAPHVTAAVALLISRKLLADGCVPDRWQILEALTSSAEPPEPPIVTDWYGAGILNAAAAIDSAVSQDDLVCLMW